MEKHKYTEEQEQEIKEKIEYLRKYSHDNVSDEKLRQGALFALGLK